VLKGREWAFSVVDARSPTTSSICVNTAWSVTAKIGYTIAPSYSGGSFSKLDGTTSASGNLLTAPACPCTTGVPVCCTTGYPTSCP